MSATIATKTKLAIHGGTPVRTELFPAYNTITEAEKKAALEVLDSGNLSQFLGCWMDDFFGGPKVRAFEEKWSKMFNAKHTVSVNSNTSGLFAAVGAAGLGPGDELIVSPYTMSASAICALVYGAVPIFADIDPDTYTLDPKSIEERITPRTKAIMVVHIFGHAADMDPIMAIARKHNLIVIEDCAQAPLTTYKGRMVGTIGDMGVFSLNYHKHIHTGEGGILVTNDDEIAKRLQLIRNHAEAVVQGMGVTDLTNMVGYNFRLGEIECAMGISQLKKLGHFVDGRQHVAQRFNQALSNLPGLTTPYVMPDSTHAYYVYPLLLDIAKLGVKRETLIKALQAEGVTGLGGGYQNVHLLPMFQKKIAYGSHGFPWTSDICHREVRYAKGICPVAEQFHDETYMGFAMCLHDLSDVDVDLIAQAFHKVWNNLSQLEHV